MPLESGSSREVIGRNIEREEAAGKKRDQAVAIALHKADVPPARDAQPGLAGAASSGMPSRMGSRSANDSWGGRRG